MIMRTQDPGDWHEENKDRTNGKRNDSGEEWDEGRRGKQIKQKQTSKTNKEVYTHSIISLDSDLGFYVKQ